jgi:uncharacterized protein YkwD
MKLFCIIIFLPFTLFSNENKFLKKFTNYIKTSYYAENVYKEHSWQSFYALNDVHQTIQTDSIDLHLLNACLFFATNKLRAIYKLPAFTMDIRLKNAASIHSYQMSINHFFSHENPYVPAIKTCSYRLKICGIQPVAGSAENCHKTFVDDDTLTYIELAQNIIESFFNSPEHKRNLMYPSFNYAACGVAYIFEDDEMVSLLVTQDFY